MPTVGNRTAAYSLPVNGLKGGENGTQTQNLAYNDANQAIGWTYDTAGNRLSDGITTATDDALNRLVTQDGTTYVYGTGSKRLCALDGAWYLGVAS